MSALAHVVASASRGDLATELARAVGGPLLAASVDAAMRREVSCLDRAPAGTDLLLYHASRAAPGVVDALLARREEIVVGVHALADPDDPFVLADLARLGTRAVGAVAASAESAELMRSLGYASVRVVPPVVDAAAVTAVEPHGPSRYHLDAAVNGTVVVVCGERLRAEARPGLALHTLHVLCTYLLDVASMVLTGEPVTPAAGAEVQELAERLHLPTAWVRGRCTESERAAFDQRAQVALVVDPSEAAALRALRAAARGVPVVAVAGGGSAEVLAGAALVLPEGSGPMLIAEAVAAAAVAGQFRESLLRAATGRLRELGQAGAPVFEAAARAALRVA